jgi:hypothetical protein
VKQPLRFWSSYDGGSTIQHDYTVSDLIPASTGILDAHGNPIYKPPNPIGFTSGPEKPRVRVKAITIKP